MACISDNIVSSDMPSHINVIIATPIQLQPASKRPQQKRMVPIKSPMKWLLMYHRSVMLFGGCNKKHRRQLSVGQCVLVALSRWLIPWWRHQMDTFSASLAICAGNSPVPGEFPVQRPVTRGVGVFFDLRLNKRLSKQSCGWWFQTPSRPLWRHRNASEFTRQNRRG